MNKKHWKTSESCKTFESREEVNDAAKRWSHNQGKDVTIYEAVAVAKFPLPDIQVVEIATDTSTPAAS